MAKFRDGLCNEYISIFTSLWFPSTSIIVRLGSGVSMITLTRSFFLLNMLKRQAFMLGMNCGAPCFVELTAECLLLLTPALTWEKEGSYKPRGLTDHICPLGARGYAFCLGVFSFFFFFPA